MSSLFTISYVLLWFVVALLFVAVFLLYRQLGKDLIKRDEGPEVNRPADLTLTTLTGASYAVKSRPHVIVFSAGECRFCEVVRPIIGELARDHGDALGVVVVHGGDVDTTRKYVSDMPAGVVAVADANRDFVQYWRLRSVPFVVVTDRHGIVRRKGIASNRQSLESLFAAAAQDSGVPA